VTEPSAKSVLLRRLVYVAGAGGFFAGGFAAGRATTPPPPVRAEPVASSGAYVRTKPGTYPAPPAHLNACYPAGTKTSPLPCLERADTSLPMLIGQCQHPATNIQDGPVVAQYAGSPAVLCCYKAEMPQCAGRPLLRGCARAPIVASLSRGGTWADPPEDSSPRRGQPS
jgi:hypothetical protein